MPTFRVELDADAIVHGVIYVEASDASLAETEAIRLADNAKWEVGSRHADLNIGTIRQELTCSNCSRLEHSCICDSI